MTVALAALLVMYVDFANITVEPVDTDDVVKKFQELKKSDDYVNAVLSNQDFWGENLTKYPELVKEVKTDVEQLLTKGARAIVKEINAEWE